MSYAQNVLGWASAYATGVVPVDLPPITGTPPPLGDAHDEHPEGLGPGLPMNIMGVPMTDPLAQIPMIDLTNSQLPSQSPMFPWMAPATPPQSQTATAWLHTDLHRPTEPAAGGTYTGTEPAAGFSTGIGLRRLALSRPPVFRRPRPRMHHPQIRRAPPVVLPRAHRRPTRRHYPQKPRHRTKPGHPAG